MNIFSYLFPSFEHVCQFPYSLFFFFVVVFFFLVVVTISTGKH